MALMRNVAGEIEGAKLAMRFCADNNIEEIDIYYDYEGIEKWCTGAWKTNKTGTIAYKKFYDEISRKVKVSFIKVKGHSGDKYNDIADRLAKDSVGVE
jgi:ribonuclease HI